MYLRASDKVTGVANFHRAVGSKLISRSLITKALHDGLAPRHGLEAVHFKYAKRLEKPLVVGVLGSGQQGLRLMAAVNPAFLTVKAIADLRPTNRIRAAAAVKGARVYNSYEELIKAAKADGLEAVIIALPSHLHAPAALAAFEAGLHVFVETPMALTVADAKKIARTAEAKALCLAVGQQRRYNWIYDHALEMVRADLLDQVHYIRSQWHVAKPEKKTGDEDAGGAESVKSDDVAKSSKIDWWQEVPKQERDLEFAGYASPEELVRWHLYEKYSGGLLAELGSQLFDAAVLFVRTSPNHNTQRPYPISVAGSASQVLRDAVGDIDDHVHCVFEYAIEGYVDAKEIPPKARKKIALQFDMILGSDFDGYGETVLGRKGSLVLESEQKAMLFHMADVDKNLRIVPKKAGEKPAGEKKDSNGAPEIDVPKDGKTDDESEALGRLALLGADAGFATELEHWAFCCKPAGDKKYSDENKPLCDAGAGLYNTVLTVAAAKALMSETRVDFKNEWFDVKSDETPDDL